MKLFVFAGPNGSGKSTIVSSFLRENASIPYICPDSIFLEYEQQHFFTDTMSLEDKYKKCLDDAEELRECHLEQSLDFCFETVFSRPDKIDFLKKAKKRGYQISSFFVGVNSPEICIERVRQRVEQGGHDVPEEKIVARYGRTMDNLKSLMDIADKINIYDNSGNGFLPVYFRENKKERLFSENIFECEWVEQYLLPYI